MKYSWLRYSVYADGVYCACCFLFGNNDSGSNKFSKSPLSDWCNLTKLLVKHDSSSSHSRHKIAADNFCAVMKGEMKDIECSISSQYNMVVEQNRNILIAIVETILFCGRQNIALRGHNEEFGNFPALLKLQAQNNTLLKTHLESAGSHTKYTSPKIQNELIEIIGKHITEDIVKKCNASEFFGFIADEATDCATIEQMAICVRYVDDSTVCEDFLGFAECKSTTGESLATGFLDKLVELGIALLYT